MNFNKKVILVFGATGTIGAYTCLYLKNMGYEVIASGRRPTDNGFFKDFNIEYVSIDISKKKDFYALNGIKINSSRSWCYARGNGRI
jgi:UDP-glucose 4-epimerase